MFPNAKNSLLKTTVLINFMVVLITGYILHVHVQVTCIVLNMQDTDPKALFWVLNHHKFPIICMLTCVLWMFSNTPMLLCSIYKMFHLHWHWTGGNYWKIADRSKTLLQQKKKEELWYINSKILKYTVLLARKNMRYK